MSKLTVEQLQRLANDPAQTFLSIAAVLHALGGSEEEGQWATEALENCGAPPDEALAAIAPLTKDASGAIASWACKLLGRAGQAAEWTEPYLVDALSRTEPTAGLETPAAVTVVDRELVREEAARALGQIGANSAAAREALAAAARQGGPRLKRLATASLGG